ncbi:MAG: choice-of-anchor V domain-containing protein [Ignavibacteria bacterium]
MKKTVCTILFFVFAAIIYINLVAFEDGIVGLTKKNGNPTGCICHGFMPDTHVSVLISGPSTVVMNDTAIFKLKVTHGPAVAGGCDISTSLGEIYTSPLDTVLRRAEEFPGSGFELTHRFPKLFETDTLEFIFEYIAPSAAGVIDTIFANSNSVNRDTTPGNDKWNYAANFLINIIEEPLPVELTSFTSSVYKRNVTLKWATASELNNSGFEIERSFTNGQTSNIWQSAGYTRGHGTVTSPNTYTFTDRDLSSGNYKYRLKQIDFNGNFKYFNLSNEINISVPSEFELSQNYPNPFNPSTQINYDLPFDSKVSIKIFDMNGKEVAVLLDEKKSAGYYTLNFNAGSMASGVYIYRISVNDFTISKKMMLIK